MDTDIVIELSHVGMKFGNTVVHRDISFQIRAGETVTIMGPSGTGKTILLKLIMGFLTPTTGTVKVFGEDVSLLDDNGLRKVRRNIGMLFQGAALFDSLSVFDNIAYGLREHGNKDEEQIAAIVFEKLEMVGLAGFDRKFPPELSGGQKKRIGLARALAPAPSVMLFDEPTTGLDPSAKRLIDDVIARMNETYGMTSIAVTHDIESANRISARWILLHEGLVVADGLAADLSRSNQEAIDFIQGNWKDE